MIFFYISWSKICLNSGTSSALKLTFSNRNEKLWKGVTGLVKGKPQSIEKTFKIFSSKDVDVSFDGFIPYF